MFRTWKWHSLWLALVPVLVLANSSTSYSQTPKIEEPKKLNITMAGLASGGAYASIGEGVLECIRKSYPGSTASYEAGQEGANIALVGSGKLQVGIANSQLVQMAYVGTGPFSNRKITNLRCLALLYEDVYFHFLIKKSTGIKSIDDIKTKKYPLKINFNTKGSFMQIAGEEMLKAYGISEGDIKSWGGRIGYMTAAESIDQMRGNVTDAFVTTVQSPFSAFVDAALTMDLALLPINDEAIEKANKALYTTKALIPKGSYSFVQEDVPTIRSSVILFGNSGLSDSEAYAIVKAISNNIEYMRGIHSSVKNLNVKTLSTITGKTPMHTGAEIYYKEKGLL